MNRLINTSLDFFFRGKNYYLFTFKGIPAYISRHTLIYASLISLLVSFSAETWIGVVQKGAITTICTFVMYSLVIIHEYGHSIAAKSLGYEVDSIILWVFGGLASIEGDWYKNPKHEFLITFFGPFTNLALAVVCIPFISWGLIFYLFFLFNSILLVFNLLPIYPMDGGRMVRAFYNWFFGDLLKATRFAIGTSILFCTVIAPIIFIWFNPITAGLLVFVISMGWNEYKYLKEEMADKEKIKLMNIDDNSSLS